MYDVILAIIQLPLLLLFTFWLFLLLTHRRTEHIPPRNLSVTVLVPAYNEESRIAKCLDALKMSDYPVEIIVVDDGSTDRTPIIALQRGVRVIRLPHMGKAPALNAALEGIKSDVVVIVDADTYVLPDTISRLVAPFSDPNVAAVFGKLRPANRGILPAFQELEYIYVGELSEAHYSRGFPLPFVFGALSAFRTNVLREVGGFPLGTAGEDVDLLYTILGKGYDVAPSSALAFTVVPETIPQLFSQRWRWISAGVRIFRKHFGKVPKKAHYSLLLYIFWPIYGVLSYPLLLYSFFYWIPRLPPQELFLHILSWFTYVGPIRTLLNLPSWGVTFPILVGLLLGLISLALFLVSLLRDGLNLRRAISLFFFPIYGTFLLGLILFTSPLAVLRAQQVFKR